MNRQGSINYVVQLALDLTKALDGTSRRELVPPDGIDDRTGITVRGALAELQLAIDDFVLPDRA